jgi:hypothetical protein
MTSLRVKKRTLTQLTWWAGRFKGLVVFFLDRINRRSGEFWSVRSGYPIRFSAISRLGRSGSPPSDDRPRRI